MYFPPKIKGKQVKIPHVSDCILCLSGSRPENKRPLLSGHDGLRFFSFLFFSDLKSLVGISLCIYLNPAQPLKTRQIFSAATRGSLNLILSSPCRCYPRQWRLISSHTCTVSLMRGKRIYPLDSYDSRCFLHQRRRKEKKNPIIMALNG